ncbi:hypothetical protein [Phaeocystidibacter marisrubri]|uniref:DUF4293 family protein n=1 Tax=Phaeocystidibacter marisrubri TaxID=1577780 RepID=A0A6L3ZFT6_9FLAO|nr:hypothetical protein [Phaeocystidibacter marisrubri]KAB2816267.1 hypothetical protein F8C82_11315 [Phaeocystidibacter marisrubri]GGH68167.1 hypothetical protein GCM10011318_07910 [Phaeocystidibacter marisrubri]
MKTILSFQRASQLALLLFSLLEVFHLSIILGIVLFDFAPVEYLWGGKMKTAEELLVFEFISLIIMTICLLVVLIRTKILRLPKLMKVSRVLLWVLTVIFALNTLGNLLAESSFEKFFAIATLLLAFISLRMALEPVEVKE